MKKIFLMLLAVLMVVGLLPVTVSAAPGITLTVTPTPGSLTEPGNVSFAVSVKNTGDTDVNNARVTAENGTYAVDLGTITPGDTKSEYIVLYISEDMFGKSIPFKATAEDSNGTTVESSKSSKVTKSGGDVKIVGSCSSNKTSTAAGGKIAVTFTVENQGGVDLTNVRLSIPPVNGGKTITNAFSLTTGAKRSFPYEFTINEDTEIVPTIKYTANGVDGEQTLNAKKFTIANPKLELKLSVDNKEPKPGDTVTFTVEVKNAGNVNLSEIKVYDFNQSQVTLKSATLKPGTTTTATHQMVINQSTNAVFTATAKDSDNQISNYSSNQLKVGTPIDPTKVGVTLSVKANKSQLDTPGKVRLEVTAVNSGEYQLTNLVVIEDTLGEFGTAITIGVGEDKLFSKEVDISDTKTFQFKATYKDMDEAEYSATAEPLTIEVLPPVQEPEEEEIPQETPAPAETSGNGTIITIIIVIVVLIAAVVVALILLVRKEKMNRRPSGGGGYPTGGRSSSTPRSGSRPQGPRPPPPAGPRPGSGSGSSGTRPRPPAPPSGGSRPTGSVTRAPQGTRPRPPQGTPPKSGGTPGEFKPRSKSNFKGDL